MHWEGRASDANLGGMHGRETVSMTDAFTPVVLHDKVDPVPELRHHPEEVTEHEATFGHVTWKAVDDVDDESDGVDTPARMRSLAAAAEGRTLAMVRAMIVRDTLLRHGVPEVSLEVQAGRPTYGPDPWNACRPVNVTSHHIASRPTPQNPTPGLWLVKRGRSDLPGPLANGTAGVDLVYRILTLGYANHPGEGGPMLVSGPCGAYTIPKDVGRPYMWGTEYEGGYDDDTWDRVYTNKRTGARMTFREFMGRCNAGLVEAIWRINGHGRRPPPGADLAGYHCEHKTWAPHRKTDRLNYTTESGRAELRRYAQEDDMPTPEDLWNHPVPVFDGKEGETAAARVVLAQTHNRAGEAWANAARARRAAEAAVAQAKRNRDVLRRLVPMIKDIPDDVAAEIDRILAENE